MGSITSAIADDEDSWDHFYKRLKNSAMSMTKDEFPGALECFERYVYTAPHQARAAAFDILDLIALRHGLPKLDPYLKTGVKERPPLPSPQEIAEKLVFANAAIPSNLLAPIREIVANAITFDRGLRK
jgi:hypothetical protein